MFQAGTGRAGLEQKTVKEPAQKDVLYLRWGSRRNRADDLASALDAELVALQWRTTNPALVPVRYGVQFLQTLAILMRRRPRLIYSQHTQPFCSFAAVLYGRLSRTPVITDCHNTPFVDWPWTAWPANWIARFVYRNAALNLVHNEGIRDYVIHELRYSGRFEVLHDPIPEMKPGSAPDLRRPAVVVISSFAADEPARAMLQATRQTPEAHYYITGDTRRLPPPLRDLAGDNVTFTGFLPDADYDALITNADAAMALSTRENVLTRACHEAMSAGVPFIASDTRVARRYLSGGTTFVKNSSTGITHGIREALADHARLRSEMQALKEVRHREWKKRIQEIKAGAGGTF